MELGEYLRRHGHGLEFELAIDLWHAAARELRRATDAHRFHKRLDFRSFAIDPEGGPSTLRIADADLIADETTELDGSIGTVWRFASPEQTGLSHSVRGPAANIFNLGALGYSLLTGREPFADLSGIELAEAIVSRPMPMIELDGVDPPVTDLLNRVISRATAKRIQDRYPSLDHFAADLSLLLRSKKGNSKTRRLPLVGRSETLERIYMLIESARNGGEVRFLLSGEAGIGKSFLWQAVVSSQRVVEERWVYFKAPQTGDIPYAGYSVLLDQLIEAIPDESPSKLRKMLFDAGVSDRGLHMAATILPRFGSKIGEESRQAGPSVAGNPEGMESELAVLVLALARSDNLTVLAIDDLQWLDDQSADVLDRMLEIRHPRTVIALLSRLGGRDRVAHLSSVEEIRLQGLKELETLSILEGLLLPGRTSRELSVLNRRIQRRARGNPMATVNLLQLIRSDHEESDAAFPEFLSDVVHPDRHHHGQEIEMLVELARSRLEVVSEECRRALCYLSLLLPPVRLGTALTTLKEVSPDPARVLTQAEESLLLTVDYERELVWFSHDTIESIARREAMADPHLVEMAARALLESATGGSERASFALARLLVGNGTERQLSTNEEHGAIRLSGLEQHLSENDAVETLFAAATRALELVIPDDAARFSNAALELLGDDFDGDASLRALRLRLNTISHESAFLRDDVGEMSRRFLRIRSLGGPLDINEARQRWIARTYAKSWFASAIRIGWIVFRELEAVRPGAEILDVEREARRFLRSNSPRVILRRLLKTRATQDKRPALIVTTCVRLILPALSVDKKQLPVMVHLIIKESLAAGRTGFSGMGFVCWALYDGATREREIGDKRILEYALEMASETGDARARHTIRTYAHIFNGFSRAPYQENLARLPALFEEGTRLANFEFAGQALHIHGHGLFYLGRPLPEVYRVMGDYRRKLLAIHNDRTEKAHRKFQQAVECLMGHTSNALELTGSICNEAEYLAEIEMDGDGLSIAGFYLLKALLATFADKPSLALQHSRLYGKRRAEGAGLYGKFVGQFIWGMAAFRMGAVSEGLRIMKRFRYWARVMPGNQIHRYLALRAEHAAAKGLPMKASRRYSRATQQALGNGYLLEGALFAEREGDLLRAADCPSALSEERLHLAQSLYSRLCAGPSVERVRRKLRWVETPTAYDPVLSDESYLKRIISAPSNEAVGQIVLDQASLYTAASEAHALIEIEGCHTLASHRLRGGRASEERADEPAKATAAIVALLRNLPPGAHAMEHPTTVGRKSRPVLASRANPSTTVGVSVCLLGASGAPAFSSFVTSRVSAAVLLAASILQLREAVFAEARQTRALETTQEELARTQEYSRVLFGTLPDAMLLVDGSLNVLFHNRSADGYVVDGAGGPTQFEEGVEAIVGRAVERVEGEPTGGEVEEVWRGRVISVGAIRPGFSDGQEPPGIFAVTIRDVTEVKRQEEELRRKEQQLIIADRMASIGMFSSAIAHEVSNPNHILKLNAQSLATVLEHWRIEGDTVAGTAIEEAREIVEKISEGTRRIEGVVEQVKEYGREGRRTVWEAVDPGEVCERALRFSRIMASQHTKHLSYERQGEGPAVLGDRGQLEQAVINLIKNACEALETVDGTVKVSVEYGERGEEATIAVADTGPGIDPSIVEMLGEPFSTTRGGNGGTGLGLSIVRTIAERHNGRFSFSVGAGFNTIACLTIPTMSRAADQTETEE